MAPPPPRPSLARVLVVEDDPQLAELLDSVLENAPFRCRTESVSSLRQARRALQGELPQAIVLDMALPDGTGLELLRTVRADERTRRLPVLVQTASVGEKLSVECLKHGADDFIEKPFDSEELLARLAALLRRYGWSAEEESGLECEPLALDTKDRDGLCFGRKLGLTDIEFRLLKTLFDAKGGVVLAQDLVRGVLHVSEPGVLRAALKDLLVHMSNLRKKFGSQKKRLRNKRGVGYQLALPES
ncbi:MAG: response regulator transcription factor [Elusimicrobia bacterium]|nr:response regulator transcription factor [Elusimicrobiota bacterium]